MNEVEQGSLLHPFSQEKPVEKIRRLSEKQAILEESYIWPCQKPQNEEQLQEKLQAEADILQSMEHLARFAVTVQDKMQYMISVWYYMIDIEKKNGIIHKAITWEEFRRLFWHYTKEYAKGRTSFD